MEWIISHAPMPYERAVIDMGDHVDMMQRDLAGEQVWLLEHPAIYTAGASAKDSDLINTLGFPVYKSQRGGQYTYHGPGQRVAYVMLNLNRRKTDVRLYVQLLEEWIIRTLAEFDIKGERREGRVGIWVNTRNPSGKPGGVLHDDPAGQIVRSAIGGGAPPEKNSDAKIAALGVRISKWITYHGISLNVDPDLSHYRGIVPCGIREYGVTSLAALGVKTDMQEVDKKLVQTFRDVF